MLCLRLASLILRGCDLASKARRQVIDAIRGEDLVQSGRYQVAFKIRYFRALPHESGEDKLETRESSVLYAESG